MVVHHRKAHKTPSRRLYRPKRGIKVTERKLGKHKAMGLAHSDGLVEVDPRQEAKDYLDTLIHELLHVIDPSKEWSEATVERVANTLTYYLWKAGFRRVRD